MLASCICCQCKNMYVGDGGVVWAVKKSVLYEHTRVLLPLLLLVLCVLLYSCFLLLFVVVYRMAIFFGGSLKLIAVFSLSSFKRDEFLCFFMYPSAVLCRIYGLDWPTSSVIAGMRGAKAGVGPPRRIPPCIRLYTYIRRHWPELISVSRKRSTHTVYETRQGLGVSTISIYLLKSI